MVASRRAALAIALTLTVCRPFPAAAAPADDLRFLPADTQIVLFLRVDDLLANRENVELPRELRPLARLEEEAEKAVRAEVGTSLANLESLLVGGSVKGDPLEVVRFREPVKVSDILAARRQPRDKGDKATAYKEDRVGTFTIYAPDRQDVDAFCAFEPKGVLLARPMVLGAVLGRGKRPQFGADMEAALELVDFKRTFAGAFDVRACRAGNGGKFHVVPWLRSLDLDNLLKGANSAAFSIQLGKEFDLRLSMRFEDAASARTARERTYAEFVKTAQALATERYTRQLAADLIRKINLEVEGPVVRIRLALTPASFKRLLGPDYTYFQFLLASSLSDRFATGVPNVSRHVVRRVPSDG
jgi:hypothetical protein